MPRRRTETIEGDQPHFSYINARDQVEDILGALQDENWEALSRAFHELRKFIEEMQWISEGENTVAGQKREGKYREIAFACKDKKQEDDITYLLESMGIFPWVETRDGVSVLIVENWRDIALLRAGMIFAFLESSKKDIERRKKEEELNAAAQEAREAYDRQMQVVQEYLANLRQEAEKKHAEEERLRLQAKLKEEEERANELRMQLMRDDYLKKSKAEREARIAGFFAAIKIPERELKAELQSIRKDSYFAFGNLFTVGTPSRKAKKVEQPTHYDEPEIHDVGEEMAYIKEAFQSGLIHEGDIDERVERHSVRPSASFKVIFPHIWHWSGGRTDDGHYTNIETGEKLTHKDITKIAIEYRDASKERRDEITTLMILVFRQLFLKTIQELHKRYQVRSEDELFGIATMAIIYALDHNRPEEYEDSKFVSYAMRCAEGYMRKVVIADYAPSLTIAPNMSSERKKLHEIRKGLQLLHPERAILEHEVEKEAKDKGITQGLSLEAYIRKIHAVYTEVDLDILDTDLVGEHDITMLGLRAFVEPDIETAETKELKTIFTHMLRHLAPRVEKVVRLYFDMYNTAPVSTKIYSGLAKEFYDSPDAVDKVMERIHKLTSVGDLTKQSVLEGLSTDDRYFVARYQDRLQMYVQETTLDDVAGVYGVTRERIRQMLNRAYRRLAFLAKQMPYKAYFKIVREELDAHPERLLGKSLRYSEYD